MMGNRRISDDAKSIALRLKARGRDTNSEIAQLCNFSTRTLYRAMQRKNITGSVSKAQAIGRGRPRRVLFKDCQYLLRLARHKPTLFLDEYTRRLEEYRHLPVSLSTVHLTLRRAGLSVKHVQKLALERDPIQRADFVRRIGQYPAHYLVPLDEVSKDDRTYSRLWGRAEVGCRVEEHSPFVRKRRLSMISALALDEGIIASRVIEGSYTCETFLEYLRDDVVSCFGSLFSHIHPGLIVSV
jgi:transposase